jgi:hypothetical protein
LICASVESGCKLWSTFHIVQAGHAMEHRYARPITYHSKSAGDLPLAVQSLAFAGGATPSVAPTVRSSSRLGFPWRPVYPILSDFAYRP